MTRTTSSHRTRRQALGQHFLSERGAVLRIIAAFAPQPGEQVLEIGPGRGAMTLPLLEAGARVIAVEVDPSLASRLAERFEGHAALTLHRGDVLGCDLAELVSGGPARVLANLPYSITGAVLVKLFAAAPALTEMMVMLQREVVERIVAAPGGRIYGSLSVLTQYFTNPKVVMKLGPGAFTPPPAVDSAVVRMTFRPSRELSPAQEREYPVFVRALFAHRRQTLQNNLKAAAFAAELPPAEIAARLEKAGIEPRRRPETLSRTECLRVHAAFMTGT